MSFKFKAPLTDKNDFSKIPNTEAYAFSKTLINNFGFALDVGAHIGTMARLIANDFKQVQCFEPAFYDYTRENTSDLENVIVEPYALGDENKQEEMYIMDHKTGGSSIVKHPRRWEKWQKNAGTKTINVRQLDSYKLSNIDFIKIDVESYEYFVINGAKETLRNNSPVIMIEYLSKYPHSKFPPSTTDQLLVDLGYKKIKNIKDDYIYIKEL